MLPLEKYCFSGWWYSYWHTIAIGEYGGQNASSFIVSHCRSIEFTDELANLMKHWILLPLILRMLKTVWYQNNEAPSAGVLGNIISSNSETTVICNHSKSKFLRIREDSHILRSRRSRRSHAFLSWKKTGSGPNGRHMTEKRGLRILYHEFGMLRKSLHHSVPQILSQWRFPEPGE